MKIIFLFILVISFINESFSQIKSLNEFIEIGKISPTKIKDSLATNWFLINNKDNEFSFSSCKEKSLDRCEQIMIVQIEDSSIQLLSRNFNIYSEFLSQAKEKNLKLIKKEKKWGLRLYQGVNFKIEFSQVCRGKKAAYLCKLIKE
jgi:hypothetical protein